MKWLVALGALAVVAACGGSVDPEPAASSAPTIPPASSAPAKAVEDLLRALDDGDCPAAKMLVLLPSELDCGVVEGLRDSFADEGIHLDKVRYRAGEIHDDNVTVTITWDNDFPPESYDVQRVGRRWKVVFDSAA